MASIIQTTLQLFPQNNKIIKTGKDLLMSGELDLTDLDAVSVSIDCYIGKHKSALSQELEGNVRTFPSYVMAEPDVSPTITTHDLLVTERGEIFIVGPTSQRNNDTTINGVSNYSAYFRADLELYEG